MFVKHFSEHMLSSTVTYFMNQLSFTFFLCISPSSLASVFQTLFHSERQWAVSWVYPAERNTAHIWMPLTRYLN